MSYPIDIGIQNTLIQCHQFFTMMHELALSSVLMDIKKPTMKPLSSMETLLEGLLMIYPELEKTESAPLKAYAVWLSVTYDNLEEPNAIAKKFVYEYDEVDKRDGIDHLENYLEHAFSGDNPNLMHGSLWNSFIDQYGESKYLETELYEQLEKYVKQFDSFVSDYR